MSKESLKEIGQLNNKLLNDLDLGMANRIKKVKIEAKPQELSNITNIFIKILHIFKIYFKKII